MRSIRGQLILYYQLEKQLNKQHWNQIPNELKVHIWEQLGIHIGDLCDQLENQLKEDHAKH